MDVTDREWDILEIIAEKCPTSVIAGGFLRDTILDKPVKDIDVFVHKSWETALQSIKGLKKTSKEVLYCTSQFTSYQVEGTRLNILVVNNGMEPIQWVENKFDVGLCKVYFTLGNKELTRTEEFDKDVENKTLTVDLNSLGSNESYRTVFGQHIPRLLKKYPDYEIKIVGEENVSSRVDFSFTSPTIAFTGTAPPPTIGRIVPPLPTITTLGSGGIAKIDYGDSSASSKTFIKSKLGLFK